LPVGGSVGGKVGGQLFAEIAVCLAWVQGHKGRLRR